MRARQEVEYQLLQAELQLAQQVRPYLLFDWQAGEVLVKQKGTPVARLPIQLGDDPAAVRRFQQRFLGDDGRAARGILSRRLYTAKHQHPDSILAIVGQVLEVDPQFLQRNIPGRFELEWANGAVLEVQTDLQVAPRPGSTTRWQRLRRAIAAAFDTSGLRACRCAVAELLERDAGGLTSALAAVLGDQRLLALRRTVSGQCFQTRLRARMASQDGLVLYRVARPGAPTLMPLTF